jgi:hypothetical protein
MHIFIVRQGVMRCQRVVICIKVTCLIVSLNCAYMRSCMVNCNTRLYFLQRLNEFLYR